MHKAIHQQLMPQCASFFISDAILYVSVVTLSTGDDNKLLQQLKQDLKEQLDEARKFHIRRNKNKAESIETGCIVIADLFP